MSAAVGRWLIVPRIATGTRRLALRLGHWHTGHQLKGSARVRAVLARVLGSGLVTWFVGGMLWALGTPPWAIVPIWLGAALAASYRDATDTTDEPEGYGTAEFIELVHDVARGGNVHLTAIKAQLVEETGRDWDVLALCREAGITTKAVRVPGADPVVTTGIHKRDLPPLPPSSSGTPDGVVAAGQPANNNSNNARIREIGGGAAVVIHTGPSNHQEARR